MPRIADRFKALQRAYAEQKKSAESKVVRWQFATGRMLWTRPLPMRLYDKSAFKGRWLKSEPAQPNYSYGFDDQDRIVAERSYDRMDRVGKIVSERFVTYGPSTVEVVEYEGRKLWMLERQELDNGRCASHESFCPGAREHDDRETYTYEKGRLTRIHDKPNDRRRFTYEVSYGADGEVSRMDLVDEQTGDRGAIFRKPISGQSVKTLVPRVEELLLELIPKAVAKSKIPGSAYSLLLVYNDENPLPPLLAVGLNAERQAWVQKHGQKEARDYVWNPAEYRCYESKDFKALWLNDDNLESACETLNGLLEDKGVGPAVKLLNNVAAQLNHYDWSRKLKTADDFVVVPVDLEEVHLKRNLKAAVPPKRLAAVKAGGWL